MWKAGYRNIAAEVSPWAANQLEFIPAEKEPQIQGLWTKQQARDVHAVAERNANVLWGCDMEEAQPQFLIREWATLNPTDVNLEKMLELAKGGYSRKLSPALLELAQAVQGGGDAIVNGISLRQNLVATLEIEKNRTGAETRMVAQNERELLMKQQFLAHLRQDPSVGASSKVLLRFGRNHLHRGIDARGISTLGNFVAEFALSQSQTIFNVGAFGAGGQETLMGRNVNADERQDELAFALLAEAAKYPATLYDPLLHQQLTKPTNMENSTCNWNH